MVPESGVTPKCRARSNLIIASMVVVKVGFQQSFLLYLQDEMNQ